MVTDCRDNLQLVFEGTWISDRGSMGIFLSRLTQYEYHDQICTAEVEGCSNSEGAATAAERLDDRGS